MRCHYEVLGVEQTADADELKKAYRKQVQLKIKTIYVQKIVIFICNVVQLQNYYSDYLKTGHSNNGSILILDL